MIVPFWLAKEINLILGPVGSEWNGYCISDYTGEDAVTFETVDFKVGDLVKGEDLYEEDNCIPAPTWPEVVQKIWDKYSIWIFVRPYKWRPTQFIHYAISDRGKTIFHSSLSHPDPNHVAFKCIEKVLKAVKSGKINPVP